jgi:putative acetyltransferase
MVHSSLDLGLAIILNRRTNPVNQITYRKIQQEDNPFMANVIRKALEEFGVARPGTVYTDPTTDALFELFKRPKSIYWIAEQNARIVGGCGIFPTEGLPEGYAELVKLYVAAEFRNAGFGHALMERSILSAEQFGYTHLYLETLPELNKAITLYERMGFEKLTHALGASGHFACDLWMTKKIKED